VRAGIYKNSILKFSLKFNQYPEETPEVHFFNKVYHPLVDYKNGMLDIKVWLVV
jgi:ubiquitin-protein ligase